MKRILNITFAVVLVSSLVLLTSNAVSAQTKTAGQGQRGALFVDKDGDGICDNVGTAVGTGANKAAGRRGQGAGIGTGSMGKGNGKGTGTGVCTGTGTGTGVCDGTGPKGAGRGRK